MFHGKQEHYKNVLRLKTFKKQRKKTFSLIKTLLVLLKNSAEALDELQDTDNIQRYG